MKMNKTKFLAVIAVAVFAFGIFTAISFAPNSSATSAVATVAFEGDYGYTSPAVANCDNEALGNSITPTFTEAKSTDSLSYYTVTGNLAYQTYAGGSIPVTLGYVDDDAYRFLISMQITQINGTAVSGTDKFIHSVTASATAVYAAWDGTGALDREGTTSEVCVQSVSKSALLAGTAFIHVGMYNGTNAYEIVLDLTDVAVGVGTEEAFRAAVAVGGNMELTDSISLTSTNLAVSTTCTLDLNGKTLTCGGKQINIGATGDLTVKDSATGGKITATGSDMFYNEGILTIQSGIFEKSSGSDLIDNENTLVITGGTLTGISLQWGTIYCGAGTTSLSSCSITNTVKWTIINNGGNLIISDGTSIALNNPENGRKSAISTQYGASLTMTGGSISASGCYGLTLGEDGGSIDISGGTISATTGIATNGSNTATCVVNITGGTINATEAGVYQPYGSFTITGGTITGETAIYTKCTDLTVTGGAISGTKNATPFNHDGDGYNTTGDAIVIENTTGYQDSPIVDIQTGTGKATITSQHASEIAFYQYGQPSKQTEIKRLALASGVDCKIAGMEGESTTASTPAKVFLTEKTGVLTVGTGATLVIKDDAEFNAKTGSTVTINGELTNSGKITLGEYELQDVHTITGPMSYSGKATITAAANSVITWGTSGNRQLTAGADGAFTVALATLSPTITAGTVTMTNTDLYPGQTVTVNEGATFAISADAMSIPEGAGIVNDGGTVKMGAHTLTGLTELAGPIAYDGDSTLTAEGLAEFTTLTMSLVADSDGAFTVALATLSPTITAGSFEMEDATVSNGQTVCVNGGSLTVSGEVTILEGAVVKVTSGVLNNDGVINVSGTLQDSGAYDATATMIVNDGQINVFDGGVLLVGYYSNGNVSGINIAGKIDVAAGGFFKNKVSNETTNVLIGEDGAWVNLTSDDIAINAESVGGPVAYTLNGVATLDDKDVFFKTGDSVTIAKDAKLIVEKLTIPTGMKVTVNGEMNVPADKKVIINGTGSIDLKGSITGSTTGAGEIFFGDATTDTVVLKVAKGATVTAVLNGTPSESATGSFKVTLTNISGGEGGFTVTKGSVYINGELATPVDGVISVTGTDVVYISGSVEEGVTINVAATATVEVATGATLTIESGAELIGKVSFSDASSAVIYEKGSKVNGSTIAVTTKETSSGTEVKVTITLVSQDGNKLIINGATTVEVFTDDTYGDALKDVVVIPAKKFITFDGWYLLANNEKVSMSQDVLDYDHVLTACFTDERGSPITPDDSSSSETHYIPLSDNGDQIEIALPAAFVMLILSIFVLGFVVVKKRK